MHKLTSVGDKKDRKHEVTECQAEQATCRVASPRPHKVGLPANIAYRPIYLYARLRMASLNTFIARHAHAQCTHTH